jgi:DNA polymerase-1
MDIETTGLDRFKHEINYIGVGLVRDIGEPLGKTVILNMYDNKDQGRFDSIVRLLRKHKIKLVWQNGKFDTLFIAQKYGVLLPIHHDVMLMGTAYDMSASHALDTMAEAYLGIASWDIPLKEKIKPNNPIVEKYLMKDIAVPWELFCYFLDSLTPLKWKHYYKLLKPAFLMFRRAEKTGIYWDKAKHAKVSKEYRRREQETLAALKECYDINWNSSKQVADVLFNKSNGEGLPQIKVSPKTGNPSADAKVLRRLAAKGYDLPNKLLEYKFYYGANTKFLNQWPKYASYDGRIHPSFNITNVVTGRTSCKNPNLQQVPRNKELRTQFTAAKGRVLIEADYSQLELRIAADYSQDKTMLKIYREGGDIHTETAMTITGKPRDRIVKEDRTGAKGVNFGYLYGMLAKKYRDYAFDTYGLVVTMQEAERSRQLFFNKYSGLLGWHSETEQICEALGGVENKFGRFRSLPNIYSRDRWERLDAIRKAINTPVQSTGSDLLLFASIECDETLRPSMDLRIVGTVHDAILFDCPEDAVKDALREIKRIMESPKALEWFDVSFSVPIEADVSVGAWGEN